MSAPLPDPPSSRRAVVAVVIAIGLAAVALAIYAWQVLSDVALSVNGYIALALGMVGTAALAGGLMTLVFYSHRHGYDDRAGGAEGEQDRKTQPGA